MRKTQRHVVAPIRVDTRTVRAHRGLGVDHHRQRIVVNGHQVGRILGLGTASGHDHGHRLPGVTHDLLSQRVLGRGTLANPETRVQSRWRCTGNRHRLHPVTQVGKTKHPGHAGMRLRRMAIDATNPGMGMRTAHDRRMQKAG